MTIKSILMAATVATSVFAVPSVGAEDTVDKSKINPWRHCGIGAMIFSDESEEVGAVISNIIWDLGTTAVSSKLSSPESCEGEAIKTAALFQKTYAQLSADTARGEGRYLTAALDSMNCAPEARPALVADMRENLADLLASDAAQKDNTAKAELFYMAMSEDVAAKYSAQCSIA